MDSGPLQSVCLIAPSVRKLNFPNDGRRWTDVDSGFLSSTDSFPIAQSAALARSEVVFTYRWDDPEISDPNSVNNSSDLDLWQRDGIFSLDPK